MRLSVVLAALLLLTGCEPRLAIDADFERYLSRIANVQQRDALSPPAMVAQSLPEKRKLLIAIDPVTISLLDSYELRQCGLFELIAERNSILGKVQDEFREWDYQVALLNGIQGCLTSPQLSQSLKAQLLDIQNIKQQELASRWHNLLYTSETMRTQLSGSQWYDEQWSHSELLLALEQLNTIQHQLVSEHPIASEPLASQQEVLEKQRLLGHLKFSLDRASVWLKVVTQQLENNDDAIVCGPHRDNTKLNYLRNVFQSQYIEKIQPYLASLDRTYYQLSAQLGLFEQPHSPFPIQASHQTFRLATEQHAQYWQRLFARCRIAVGQAQ
ncbi:DUF3080 domain-containing protein [Vibrio cholerae]|uniref:DUF3080 domain-containing protein n=1 Tax=Vibrio cholerae TaxID=666 RepID=UPI000E0B8A26|nr:DUF3080 domain-containing protein [Vibrio cholerae]